MTLLIMAAGVGSRFGGVKQIEPVGRAGELIIDYSIYDAILAGFNRVVFIIRRDIERDFCDAIFNRIRGRIEAEYVFQDLDDLPAGFAVPDGRKRPWGTAHAILSARHVIHEPFCVINADDFYGREAFTKIAEFLRGQSLEKFPFTGEGVPSEARRGSLDLALVGYKLGNTISEKGSVSRGVCVVKNGMVTEIIERTKIEKRGEKIGYIDGETFHDLPPNADVSMNFWGFAPNIMPILNEKFVEFLKTHGQHQTAEYPIPTVVGELLQSHRATLQCLQTGAKWIGFTYPEDKATVRAEIENMISEGVYPSPLWK